MGRHIFVQRSLLSREASQGTARLLCSHLLIASTARKHLFESVCLRLLPGRLSVGSGFVTRPDKKTRHGHMDVH